MGDPKGEKEGKDKEERHPSLEAGNAKGERL